MTAISVCEELRKKETGEEKQRVKDHRSNVQRGIFLHHRGLSEGAHHAWLPRANRSRGRDVRRPDLIVADTRRRAHSLSPGALVSERSTV